MKILPIVVLLTFIFLITSCQGSKNDKQVVMHDKEKMEINQIDFFYKLQQLTKNEDYNLKKNKIEEVRARANDHKISLDSASNLFTKNLLYEVIPHWMGTAWSFEGHTITPGKGEIACGYFISTTLSDTGLKVDRIKMAQQNPYNEAKTLSGPNSVITVSKPTSEQCIEAILDNLSQGVHFIGFDANHVGYVLKNNNDLYLIHSNYKNSQGVVIEKIEDSEVFKSFNIFHLAKLSHNNWLIEQWLKHKKIVTISY